MTGIAHAGSRPRMAVATRTAGPRLPAVPETSAAYGCRIGSSRTDPVRLVLVKKP